MSTDISTSNVDQNDLSPLSAPESELNESGTQTAPVNLPIAQRRRWWILPLALVLIVGFMGSGLLILRSVEKNALNEAKQAVADRQYDQALRTLDSLLRIHPTLLAQPLELLVTHGEAKLGTGDLTGAITNLGQARALDSTSGAVASLEAQIRFAENRLPEAVTAARRAVEIDPNLGYPHALLAWEASLHGSEQDALASAEAALGRGDRSGLAELVQARSALWKGDLATAQTWLDKARNANAPASETEAVQVWIHIQNLNTDAAHTLLAALTATDKTSPASLWAQAGIKLMDEDRLAAHELVNQAIQKDERPEFFLAQYKTLAQFNEQRNFQKKLTAALETKPDFFPILAEQAIFQFSLWDLDNPAGRADELTALAPVSATGDLLNIMTAIRYNDFDRASTFSDSAIQKAPQSIDVLMLREMIWINRKEFEKADKEVATLKQIRPDTSEAFMAEIILATGKEELGQAAALASQALRKYPENAMLHLLQAQVNLLRKNFLVAKEEAEKAVKYDPQNPQLLQSVAMLLSTDPNTKSSAASYITQARSIAPKNPLILDTQAWLYFLDGRNDLARSDAKTARELDPQLAKPLYTLYLIETAENNIDTALNYASLGLELEPKNIQLLNAIADLYGRQGKYDKALEQAQKGLEIEAQDAALLNTAAKCAAALGQYDQSMQYYETILKLKKPAADAVMSTAREALGIYRFLKAPENGLRTYFNPGLKLEVAFPENWLITAQPENGLFTEADSLASLVPDPMGKTMINIAILPALFDAGYVDPMLILQYTAREFQYSGQLLEIVNTGQYLSTADQTRFAAQTYKMNNDNNVPILNKVYFAIANKNGYIVVAITPLDEYSPELEARIDQVVASMKTNVSP